MGGEWQSYDLTLVDRHITVVLNGVKVIDNQPVPGPTGGAGGSGGTGGQGSAACATPGSAGLIIYNRI